MSLISALDAQFTALHARSVELARASSTENLYRQPRDFVEHSTNRVDCFSPVYSYGEHLLRSAACVEQTFGGITANLWDDPFEWTLPESLPTMESLIKYLNEVETTRARGFAALKSDEDLRREIFVPAEDALGRMQTLAELIIETLARAAHHQGRAFATLRLFSTEKLPRV
jgi:hypothetical protein